MSKIGNHRVGIQEADDYALGWVSADSGEPEPQWPTPPYTRDELRKVDAQRLGWNDYHRQQASA